jgi:hypothetical protein
MRPCPFVSCKYHLFLDVDGSGAITLNFPIDEIDQLADSCVLDLTARDGMTLEECGKVLHVTRERVRQIEAKAIKRMKRPLESGGWR